MAESCDVRRAYRLVFARSDEIDGAFGDHDGRCVGMAADDLRHHRGVDDPQPIQAADAQLTIDHCAIVGAHAAGSTGW